jgi:site-specific DNA-methyltransferase (adenine-specific)
MLNTNYNPDVLSCIANLSSDEVFTPPSLVNQMLDLLPQEIWSDKQATFLDPACKSGVFLREIAKRLDKGLEHLIPDRQTRINHIFRKQLYGIAITELTSLLARRSLYCSKAANGKYSVTNTFKNSSGNIRFERTEHSWRQGRCNYCGANESNYNRGNDLESHAYEFIHVERPKELFKMKFDVIIGNPPYQLSDGGARASASPIYHIFVQKAMKMNPRFLTMIIPSRWFLGGKGLDNFRSEMLTDKRIREIVDFPDSTECFPGVDLSGGVCYFLWDRDNLGNCTITNVIKGIRNKLTRPLLEEGIDTFIRYNEAVSILKKINASAGLKQPRFNQLVSSRKPFGFETDYSLVEVTPFEGAVKYHSYNNDGYVSKEQVRQNNDWVDSWKVLISMAYGERISSDYWVLGKPFIGGPGTCCSETYLVIGPFETKDIAENVSSYIRTKLFRFLVLLNKPTQHATSKVYSLVPMQDFSQKWTDDELYTMYNLTEYEIDFIETMIRPMEQNDA